MRLFRPLATVAAGLGLALVSATTAAALWSDRDSVTPAAVQRGVVSFAAEAQVDPDRQYSSGAGGADLAEGSPITVTLPGSVIAQVLQGPVVWRFDVLGFAQGIAGLDYDISYPVPDDGTPLVLNTVLEGATMTVYPAGPGGDCAAAPADPPTPVDGVVSLADQVLQAPNANPTGAEQTVTWCVSLVWQADPPQYHTNVATAQGTAEDSSQPVAFSIFESFIDFAPSLDPLGTHTDVAEAVGTGVNGLTARDDHTWSAILYPDPNKEPDLDLTLTPRVTTVAASGTV